MLGTLCGLYLAYNKLSDAKQGRLKAHMTMLDIHEAALARDLCILLLLHQLNSTDDASSRTEILATLTYSFCGVVMPPYCDERSVSAIPVSKIC